MALVDLGGVDRLAGVALETAQCAVAWVERSRLAVAPGPIAELGEEPQYGLTEVVHADPIWVRTWSQARQSTSA